MRLFLDQAFFGYVDLGFPELLYSYFSQSLVDYIRFPWGTEYLELPTLPSC